MIEIEVARLRSTYGFIHIFDMRPHASRYLKPGTVTLCGVAKAGAKWWHDWAAPPDKFCKKCIDRLETLKRDLETKTERIQSGESKM